jgi:thiosulfate/3-mercaptopyruvate sulfurtransferase
MASMAGKWRAIVAAAAALVLSLAAPALLSAEGGVFISQAELRAAIGKPGVKVVDTRSAAEYGKQHLPGAVNVPFNVLQVPERDGLRSKWASDADLEKALAAVGLSYDDRVILYDTTAISGGKQYVIFQYAGFPRLSVLDGGISAWDGDVDAKPVKPTPSNFKLSRKDGSFVVGGEYVSAKIGDNRAQIIDGRGADAYEDGHIPTAQQINPSDLIKADNTLRGTSEILGLLAARGVTRDKEIVSYCGSGGAASQNYLVLRQLGFSRVVLYENSWDEWSRDTAKVQELNLPNYTFSGDGLNTTRSLGPRFLTQAELKSALEKKAVVILDVRSASDFRAGRIPGSINAYWNDTLDARRNLKPLDELAAYYAKKGVTPDKSIVLFTRGGVQLAHAFTVLKLLGFPNVSAYTGRWDGWEIPAWKALEASR